MCAHDLQVRIIFQECVSSTVGVIQAVVLKDREQISHLFTELKKHNSEAVAAAVAIFTHGLLHQNRERFPATTQNWESE